MAISAERLPRRFAPRNDKALDGTIANLPQPPASLRSAPPLRGGTSLVPPFRGLREAVGVAASLQLYRNMQSTRRGDRSS